MSFDMEEFINNIFAPRQNEVLTIMIDIPNEKAADNNEWKERREMARDWLAKISDLSSKWGMKVNPLVTYQATGGHNSGLPDRCQIGDKEAQTGDVIKSSTIILSMPEFSATAPLYEFSMSLNKLRVGSMPGAQKFMEETGLSADYGEISKRCDALIEILKDVIGAEVSFSTGHKCYFDLTENEFFSDDGILHPEMGGTEKSTSNLPAGEVYSVPNEKPGSLTAGELPFKSGNDSGVFIVKENRIIDIQGDGEEISKLRNKMDRDKAWKNIAEFAIGVNDKAMVTGNVLQDEKAGFHWAYGLSDHLGGITGEKDFLSPENVVHVDIVYARGNPIECSLLELIYADRSKKTIIRDSKLLIT